jgi:signal transduction histidine kinase
MTDPRTPPWEPVDARSALARIGLAATRLAREACTPTMRTLVDTITEAVEQLDHALGSGPLASPEVPGAARVVGDVAPVLAELRPRLVRALGARRLSLSVEAPVTAVPGDASLLRHAAVQLVRAAARVLEPEARILLGLRREPSRFGVCAALLAANGAPARVDADAWLAAPRAFARRWRGALETSSGPDAQCATLWLPLELPSCNES